MFLLIRLSLLCLLFNLPFTSAQYKTKTERPMRPTIMEAYGKLPLSFEVNQGQTNPSVKFLAHGPGYTLFLTGDSADVLLYGQKGNGAFRMELLAANRH